MKKFSLNFLAFIPFVIVTYVILIILFGQFAPAFFVKNLNYRRGAIGFMYTRMREADTTKNVDILALGSSHAYRSYDPRIFEKANLRIFSLGSSAQTPIQTKILLERYLRTMNPKFVIFDIYPFIFENDGTESTLDLICNSKIDFKTLKLAASLNNIKVYNTIIYGEYRQLLGYNKKFKESLDKGTDTYIKAGFIQSYAEYKAPRRIIDKRIELAPKQVAAFESIIEILQKKNIPYMLVQTPITQKRYRSFTNNKELDSFFSNAGEYHNFNESVRYDDSLFIDDNHLNQRGVEQFDSLLINLLNTKHIK